MMNNEPENQSTDHAQPQAQEVGSINGTPYIAPTPAPVRPAGTKSASTLISTNLIVVISGFVCFIGMMMFLLSDVRNPQDYLAPVVMTAQLTFAIALYSGKRWGLIGFSVLLAALFITIFIYYADKLVAARNTSIALSPVLLLVLNLWIRKRDYFR